MPTDPAEPDIVEVPEAQHGSSRPKVPAVRGDGAELTRPGERAYPVQQPLLQAQQGALRPWQRAGLAGGGGVLVASVLLAHFAAPVAVPCVLVGGVLWAIGFGFNRPLQSVKASKSGIGVEAEQAAAAASSIAREASDLTLRRLALSKLWIDETQHLRFRLQNPELTEPDVEREVAEFVRSRLADLTQELKGADRQVRASIWLVGVDGRMGFTFGNEIEQISKRFRPGEGIMGRAFLERRAWNVADGPRRPEYVKDGPSEPFHGLLCVPLDYGPSCIGVLCVDRTEAEVFADSSVLAASAVAAHIVMALSFLRPQAES